MQLIEEACSISNDGNYKKALLKAKEASNKERNLIRIQEQSGLSDHHNMDLTYAVGKFYLCMITKMMLKNKSLDLCIVLKLSR